MSDMFQPGSPFIRFLTRVCDCVILNLLLVLMTITVVFSGVGLVSVYAVTLKMVRLEEGGTVKNYFRSIRNNFIASVPATIILMVDVFILAVLYYALRTDTLVLTPGLFVLLFIIAILLTAFLSYLLPLIARFDNTFGGQCRNAVKLGLANLPVTVMMTIINMAPFLTTAFAPGMAGYISAFWITIGVAAGAYLDSYYLRIIFDKFTITGRTE